MSVFVCLRASLPVCAFVFVLVCGLVCMYVCLYVVHACVCLYVCMFACVFALVYLCVVCAPVCMCVHTFYTHTVCGCMFTRVCPCVHVCAHVSMLEYGCIQRRALSPSGEAVKFLCSHRCPVLEARGPRGVLRLVTTCPCFRAPAPRYLAPMKQATGGRGAHTSPFLGSSRGWGESEAAGRGCLRTPDTQALAPTLYPAGASLPASLLRVRLEKSKVSRGGCTASLKCPAGVREHSPHCGLPLPHPPRTTEGA